MKFIQLKVDMIVSSYHVGKVIISTWVDSQICTMTSDMSDEEGTDDLYAKEDSAHVVSCCMPE